MADIFPSGPPPARPPSSGSRVPLARRLGIGACAALVLLGGLGHVIGWHMTLIAVAVAGGVTVLVLLVRKVRGRASSSKGPKMPRIPKMGRIPKAPRMGGMPRLGGMPRGPRGALGRMGGPRGRGMSVPRGALGARKAGAGGLRSRVPGLGAKGRPGTRTGLPRAKPGAKAAGRSAAARLGLRPKSGASGSRPRSGSRAGSRPGARSRTGTPRPPGSPPRRRGSGAATGGARSRPGSRPGSRSGAGSPGRVRGIRRLVPRRFRPASWTRPPAAGRRPKPGARSGSRPAGYTPPRRWWRRPGGRSRRAGAARPTRVRVRRSRVRRVMAWRPWRRRPAGPKPFKPWSKRPFTQAWLLHHVRRAGRAWRRPSAVSARGAARAKAGAPRKWVTAKAAKMQAFLIGWRFRKAKRVKAAGTPAGAPDPTWVYSGPVSSPADPYAARRPDPAPPRPAASPSPGPAYAPSAGAAPSTGGYDMAPASPKVQNLVEATDEAFSGFQPERVVPDVEALLAHLPEWFDSIGSNWKKFAEQAQGDLPVHPDVSEAMLDMMPHIQALSEAAGKVNDLFRQRHADDLKRHYEPRAGEAKWDVNA